MVFNSLKSTLYHSTFILLTSLASIGHSADSFEGVELSVGDRVFLKTYGPLQITDIVNSVAYEYVNDEPIYQTQGSEQVMAEPGSYKIERNINEDEISVDLSENCFLYGGCVGTMLARNLEHAVYTSNVENPTKNAFIRFKRTEKTPKHSTHYKLDGADIDFASRERIQRFASDDEWEKFKLAALKDDVDGYYEKKLGMLEKEYEKQRL